MGQKFTRAEEKVPGIWDENSPVITMLLHKWERAHLKGWNNARIEKLANDLGITVWILCAYAGAFKHDYDFKREMMRLKFDVHLIRSCWRDNLWPVWLTAQFERFERVAAVKNGAKAASLLGPTDKIAIGIANQ